MPVPNFSAYRPAPDDALDANQIANVIDAIQDALNNVGDTSLMTWETGMIIGLDQLTQSSASANQVPVWNGSAWVATTITDLNTYYKKTSEKDVANTASKTDLLNGEITIGAGKMPANGLIKVYAGGDYLNDTGQGRTFSIELKLGSQVIWDSGASDSVGAATARRPWHFQAVIQALNSQTSQKTTGVFWLNDNQAATTGLGAIRDASGHSYGGAFYGAATTVDMTTGQTLTLSVTHSASSASLSMRLEHARIEVFA